jgi:site-specific DNA recombinase
MRVMKKRLIGYLRVSSEISKKKGNSIENQHNKIIDYCSLNDFELIDVLKDEGLSGMSYNKREGYKQLMEVVKSKSVDGIIVYSLSRLGRKMSDVIQIMELFSKNNIDFYSVKENINNKDMMGRLLMNVLMSFNEFEVENIRERIRDVKQNNKLNGLVYGKLHYGKNKDGKKLIDNKKELEVIKYIKNLRSRGWSYFRISDKLNEKGIKGKNNGKWYGCSVRNVLSYY